MTAFGRIGMGALFAAAALVSGCASIDNQRGYRAEEVLVAAIQPGIDNKASVEGTLGRPTFTSEYGDESWYYVSNLTRQKPFNSPKIREHTVLAIHFDSAGNVVATEESGVDRLVKLDPEDDKTPTLGKDRTFLQDLFGNIGAVGAPVGGGPGGNTGP